LQSTNIVTELITLTPELIPYIALYGTNTIKFTMAFLGAVNVPMTWDGEKYTDGVNYIYKSGSAWLFHDDPNSYNADLFLNSATFPWEGTWVVNNEFASGYSLTVITNTPDAYTNTGIVIWDFAASEQQIVDARNPNFTSLQIIPTNALAGRKSALRIQANTTMPIVITNQLAWLNGVDNTNVITSDVLISAQCWSENLTDTAAAISSVGSLTVDNLSVGNLSVGSGNGGGLTNLQATNIVFQDKIWSGTELNDYYNAILELNNGYQRYEWGGDNVFTITGITPAATGKPRWTSFKLLNSYSGNITLTISITDARAIGSASPFTIPQNKVAWITIHDDGQGTAWSITYAVAIEP
jgi:hypothetical protein